MSEIPNTYLTISDIAELEGVSHTQVARLIEQYNVRTVPLGNMRIVSAEEYRKIPPAEERRKNKGGRPKQ